MLWIGFLTYFDVVMVMKRLINALQKLEKNYIDKEITLNSHGEVEDIEHYSCATIIYQMQVHEDNDASMSSYIVNNAASAYEYCNI